MRPYIPCKFPEIWARLDKGVLFGTRLFKLQAGLESRIWLGPGFWDSTLTLEVSTAFITESRTCMMS